MITGNEPAYPSDKEYTEGGKDFLDAPIIVHRQSFGLTKREYFAARAMHGLCSNSAHIETFSGNNPTPVPSYIAEIAVNLADALIAALNKQP